MHQEANKALYRRFIDDVFNDGRLDRLEELLSPSYVLHDVPPGAPHGADAVRGVVTMFRSAFPDLRVTLEALVAEGDLVCARATTRGTHQGEIFGVPPSGNAVVMPGLTMVRIAEGRILESWVKNDTMGLMKQLAAVPVGVR